MSTTIERTTTEGPVGASPPAASPRVRPARNRPALRALRSLGRAAGVALPVLLLTSLLTFALGALADQEPAEIMLGEAATADDVARLEHELGLDRPVIVQYASWLASAVRGDLGTSWFTGIPVSESIAQRLPVSLSIALFALLIAIVLGAVFGILAAVRRGGVLDRAVTLVSATIATLPPFVLAIGLIVVFGVTFPALPTGGYVDPAIDTGAWLRSMVLPAVALAFDGAADLARQLRTGLVGALGEGYIVGARLRGLSPARVLFVHALRNGVGPAVSALGLQLPRLIGGAIIAEAIFSIPGLGLLARDAAMRGDVPVVVGSLLVTVVMVLVASLVVNVLLSVLRPETRRRSA